MSGVVGDVERHGGKYAADHPGRLVWIHAPPGPDFHIIA
jgi:hypothetical protein